MKNYKFLVPILLVVLFVASVYMLIDNKAQAARKYNETLEAAREYRAQDIQVDAEEQYMDALSQEASLELYIEIGEFYRDTEQTKKAIRWGESVALKYPEQKEVYEFLMPIHEAKGDYVACYKLAETMTKRGVSSDAVAEALERMEYYFYFSGSYSDVKAFSESRCPVMIKDQWGYADGSGKEIIEALYSYAGPFMEGLAPVVDMEGNAFFIDADGNKKHVVLNVENVKKVGFMEQGVFPLYDGQSWSFYNTDHELVFGGYEDATPLGNDVAAVMVNGQWMLVDSKGNDLTGKRYDAVKADEKEIIYRNERLFVADGTGYSMIDKSGKVISTQVYEDVQIFNNHGDQAYAAVMIGGKWGFVDKNGEMVIDAIYNDARSFSNGLAAVEVDEAWGYIDLQGVMVIEPQFDGAKEFDANGCAFVLIGDEWELLRMYKSNY